MRRKQWVLVEALQRKIDLALAYHAARDWDELSEKLGASPKTIRWWIQGSANHAPGDMPQDAFAALCALCAKVLPDVAGGTVEALVVGAASDLEDALAHNTNPADVLSFLHGAIQGEAKLLTFGSEPGLVEINRGDAADQLPTVPLRALFRIEFKPMRWLRAAIVLQTAGRRWGNVDATLDRDKTAIFVPGLDDDGLPLTMSEHEQPGTHRFYCVQSGRPLPTALRAELREPIELDRRVLSMLARFHERLPAGERRCQVFAMKITDRLSAA